MRSRRCRESALSRLGEPGRAARARIVRASRRGQRKIGTVQTRIRARARPCACAGVVAPHSLTSHGRVTTHDKAEEETWKVTCAEKTKKSAGKKDHCRGREQG